MGDLIYKCLICDFQTMEIRQHLSHLRSKSHTAKRELKYLSLKFEEKKKDEEIENILIELENAN